MAPEQAHSSKSSDARSDQYSLGIILYQCVTGRLPFEAETYFALLSKIVLGDFPKPRAVRPELPEELEAVILRAMAKEPTERFESVQAFGRALLPFAGEEVRVVFRRAFGSAGETAAYKAITATPSSVPSINPPPAELPLASTLSAATGERRSEAAVPAQKRAGPLVAVAGLLLVLVVGVSIRATRSTSGAVASAASPTVASSVDAGPASTTAAVAANAHAAETANAHAATQAGTDAGALSAAQSHDAGARTRGRGRDPLQGLFNFFSPPPRRTRTQPRPNP
jgi:hypothetical protein